jgi:hypothetical protein
VLGDGDGDELERMERKERKEWKETEKPTYRRVTSGINERAIISTTRDSVLAPIANRSIFLSIYEKCSG